MHPGNLASEVGYPCPVKLYVKDTLASDAAVRTLLAKHISSTATSWCRAFYVAVFACVYCYKWSILLCLLAAAWGVATALSRAAMGRHYLGDICAGMPLGVLTVAFVTKVMVTCSQAL